MNQRVLGTSVQIAAPCCVLLSTLLITWVSRMCLALEAVRLGGQDPHPVQHQSGPVGGGCSAFSLMLLGEVSRQLHREEA